MTRLELAGFLRSWFSRCVFGGRGFTSSVGGTSASLNPERGRTDLETVVGVGPRARVPPGTHTLSKQASEREREPTASPRTSRRSPAQGGAAGVNAP